MAKYTKDDLPDYIEKVPVKDIAMVIKPPMSLPTCNVIAYLAGYLLQKIQLNTCDECVKQLTIQPGDAHDENIHTFLELKAYKEGCLVFPTKEMVTFVEELETIFCTVFDNIIYIYYILTRLKNAEGCCKFLTCSNPKCIATLHQIVKLYMKLRIFHALKQSNIRNVEDKGGKRNRKMLKISHL